MQPDDQEVRMLRSQFDRLMEEHTSMRLALGRIDRALNTGFQNPGDQLGWLFAECCDAIADVWEKHGPIYY